ncbi:MAG: hypothetical protein HY692_08780 [Cyanobacteria bacterium NC_groundwater_1444_Ag_S-0.65um_54_12]|nr:hypothetical protein [Cyanobacteria bacterium NC_groundwater_1444_Ag_S-0.65um_54_12]
MFYQATGKQHKVSGRFLRLAAALTLLAGCDTSGLQQVAPTASQTATKANGSGTTLTDNTKTSEQVDKRTIINETDAKIADKGVPAAGDRGVVQIAQRALLKDRSDGYRLSANQPKSYRVMALFSDLLMVNEASSSNGNWNYGLLEDSSHFRMLETRSRNQATATGSFNVPDEDVINHLRITVEATGTPPIDAPSGTMAMRGQLEFIQVPFPLRGSVSISRVFFPAQDGNKEREWKQTWISRELRFDTRDVPSLNGQPLVIKKIMSNYLPQPGRDDIPLLEDEQQVWPDGMVLQQVTTRASDLKAFKLKGTMIMSDANRTPINFERQVALASDSITVERATMIVRNLDGVVLEFHYGTNQVFENGQIRDARGTHYASLQATGQDQVLVTYANGATESIKIN